MQSYRNVSRKQVSLVPRRLSGSKSAGNQFQNRLKSRSLIGQNLFSGQSEGGNAKAGVQGDLPLLQWPLQQFRRKYLLPITCQGWAFLKGLQLQYVFGEECLF